MKLHRLRSYEDYLMYQKHEAEALAHHLSVLEKITPPDRSEFKYDGYSYTADREVSFVVDFKHADDSGKVVWRERVCCPVTGFNNRMRATVHVFDIEMEAYKNSDIYITEQVTPIYKYFTDNYLNVTGSEYLGDLVPVGQSSEAGIRNENVCKLQFNDASFDIVISLDVLEHVPDYRKAFLECCRVLRKGGRILWSVPFVPNSVKNIICAEIRDGQVHHILPAQYHGDPLSDQGVLCFTYFGWEMLDQFRDAGFSDAYAAAFHSLKFGYLGGTQFVFIARK